MATENCSNKTKCSPKTAARHNCILKVQYPGDIFGPHTISKCAYSVQAERSETQYTQGRDRKLTHLLLLAGGASPMHTMRSNEIPFYQVAKYETKPVYVTFNGTETAHARIALVRMADQQAKPA